MLVIACSFVDKSNPGGDLIGRREFSFHDVAK